VQKETPLEHFRKIVAKRIRTPINYQLLGARCDAGVCLKRWPGVRRRAGEQASAHLFSRGRRSHRNEYTPRATSSKQLVSH
jgi:hypothetical protein